MVAPLIVTHCGAGSTHALDDLAVSAGGTGVSLLERRGRALDAACGAIVVLEDDPRTNAGTGSRMRVNGRVQMDAALMVDTLEAGAVAAIEKVRNPILVARKVMDTPHVLLVGLDATRFARRAGFRAYEPATSESRARLDETLRRIREGEVPSYYRKWRNRGLVGTVGAVVRDSCGRFCAGSSTGGTGFMMPGRVGDSPIVGSGLYCGPAGAVTATGVGEEIIKRVLSKFVYDRMAAGDPAQRACAAGVALFRRSVPIGVIAVDRHGVGVGSNRDMARWTNARQSDRSSGPDHLNA